MQYLLKRSLPTRSLGPVEVCLPTISHLASLRAWQLRQERAVENGELFLVAVHFRTLMENAGEDGTAMT